MLCGFTEPDAGVQADAGRRNAALLCDVNARAEEIPDFGDNVGVVRVELHGEGVALHVHEDNAAGGLSAEVAHERGGKP